MVDVDVRPPSSCPQDEAYVVRNNSLTYIKVEPPSTPEKRVFQRVIGQRPNDTIECINLCSSDDDSSSEPDPPSSCPQNEAYFVRDNSLTYVKVEPPSTPEKRVFHRFKGPRPNDTIERINLCSIDDDESDLILEGYNSQPSTSSKRLKVPLTMKRPLGYGENCKRTLCDGDVLRNVWPRIAKCRYVDM